MIHNNQQHKRTNWGHNFTKNLRKQMYTALGMIHNKLKIWRIVKNQKTPPVNKIKTSLLKNFIYQIVRMMEARMSHNNNKKKQLRNLNYLIT